MSNTFFSISADGKTFFCVGDWTLINVATLETTLNSQLKHISKIVTIDGSKLNNLDSAGALVLQNFIDQLKIRWPAPQRVQFNKSHQSLLEVIEKDVEKMNQPVAIPQRPNWFYEVGFWSVNKYLQFLNFLAFIGELALTVYESLFKPKLIHWRSILVGIEVTGYEALPIVALMSFLIGVVLAYQLAQQLKVYGADIYIVDVTGIAILREFAPLITAIIICGRTSTSFAALIGTMKVNEEIDALQTMGLSPMGRLVFPRIVALVIALPLLVVWADYFGILGTMIMSKSSLNIGFHAFLERFNFAVELKHYVLGLVKTPVFALIIAAVGCFQGFQVTTTAESVGYQTTKAAVQSIFLIIVADAGFSVLFSKMGL